MSEREQKSFSETSEFNQEQQSRREKLNEIRKNGIAFPDDFRRNYTSDQIYAEFNNKTEKELSDLNIKVSVAGRMMTRRIMGKASFVTGVWGATEQ